MSFPTPADKRIPSFDPRAVACRVDALGELLRAAAADSANVYTLRLPAFRDNVPLTTELVDAIIVECSKFGWMVTYDDDIETFFFSGHPRV